MTSRIDHGGFTLIEVLLVAALIGFLVAVATPTFLRSLHSQRLRQAARTLQQAGRFARTMAVLNGRPMALSLTPGGNTLTLQNAPPNRAAPLEAIYTREQVLAIGEPALSFTPTSPPEEDEIISAPPSRPPPQPSRTITRLLEGIRIRSVRIGEDESLEEQGHRLSVIYRPNGTCRPYTIVLENEEGRQALIHVDFVGESLFEFP